MLKTLRQTLPTLTQSNAQKSTVYALATPPGKAGIAVVRVSGPAASEVWHSVIRPVKPRPEPRRFHRCCIVDPSNEEVIDDGMAVFFRGPKSFTAEDVLELHVHSGSAIISKLLSTLSRLPFCRHAEPGEFTRRAFESGRMDLTQVEGLKALIDAETQGQRRMALNDVAGASRLRFEHFREQTVKSLALIEAIIDFSEGEDLEDGILTDASQRVQILITEVDTLLKDQRKGEIYANGLRVAIFGPPNVGKSTLLNFFAQRDAAIVTSIPGTTRDILSVSLDVGGIPVILSDTAGIHCDTSDLVEQIGIERARTAVQEADVSLCVLAFPELLKDENQTSSFKKLIPKDLLPLITPRTFFLLNKSDLAKGETLVDFPSIVWRVSLATQEGTQEFLSGFSTELDKKYRLSDNAPTITHARHRMHLEATLDYLRAYLRTCNTDIVLAAEELRYAAKEIGKISGLVETEDVLDVIFKDFCIGK